MRAFTLMELLVTLALAGVLVCVLLGSGLAEFRRSLFHSDCLALASGLRHARAETIHQIGDAAAPVLHGLYLHGTTATLFTGNSFVTRDPAHDDDTTFESIEPLAPKEIVFDSQGRTTGNVFVLTERGATPTCSVTTNAEGGISGP